MIAVHQKILSNLAIAMIMQLVHHYWIPLEHLDLHVFAHVTEYDIQSFIQGLAFTNDFFEGLKYLLLLAIYPRLVKVSQQYRQKKIKHDDVAKDYQGYKIQAEIVSYSWSPHSLVHYVVPALAHQHLKDCDNGPKQLIEVSSRSFTMLAILIFFIELYFSGEEAHAKKSKYVNE